MGQRVRGDSAFRRPALWATVAITACVLANPGVAGAAKPDLVVSDPGSPPASVAIGDPFKVTTTTANNGSRKAGSSTTRYYASFDDLRDPTDFRLSGSQRVGRLAGSKSTRSQVSLKVPADTPLDQLQLLACADDTKKVAESNGKNNCKASSSSFAVLPAITTLDLIEKARAEGEISLDEAMLFKMRAAVGYPKPPKRFRAANPTGGIDGVARGVVAEIAANWDSLSTETKLELDTYLRPPNYQGAALTDGGSPETRLRGGTPAWSCDEGLIGNPPEVSAPQVNADKWDFIETEHFRFWHYTVDDLNPVRPDQLLYRFNADPAGSLTAAQNMAAVAEHVYEQETTLFGREPLSDAAEPCNSGDGKIDVYAVRKSVSHEGAQVVPFAPGAIYRPGWMFVSPRFVADPTQARDVFAHEFAHLVQLAYDYEQVPNRLSDYGWLEEATANWAIDYVYPEDDFEHQFAGGYLWKSFTAPLWASRGAGYGGNGYEDYVFLFYVTHRFNALVMRDIWNNTESNNSVDAVDEAIPGGFMERWPEFARYNLNRGDLAHYRAWDGLQDQFKLDGSAQPHLELELKGKSRREYPWPRTEQATLEPLATKYASVDLEDDTVKRVTFRDFGFNDNGLASGAQDRIFAWWRLADGTTQVEEWTDKSEVSFCREEPEEDVQQLVLLYTNAHSDDGIAGETEHDISFPMLESGTKRSKARVIAEKRCGFPPQWSGRASGSLSEHGLTETWGATYTMDRWSQSPFFAAYGIEGGPDFGEGTIEWEISGTNDAGCTLNGSATFPGVGYLSIYSDESFSSYGTEVSRRNQFQFVNVTQDCPTSAPEQIPYTPLNCSDCAEATLPYEPGATQLSGSRSYTTALGQDVSWQWELVVGPNPPPAKR